MEPMLVSRDGGQVDVALHRRQRFDLPPRPASFPLPQTAGWTDTEPTIAAGFADDAFVMVYV